MKYKVTISQNRRHYVGEDSEYTTTERLELNVEDVEKLETIIGLFADTSVITIKSNELKED